MFATPTGDANIMSAALPSTYRGGGDVVAGPPGPPGHRGISGISFPVPESCFFFFVVVAAGVVHLEPIWLGRMKMGIVPDMTDESQAEAPESPSLLKMGLRTGRQALMTPRRASRQVKRARREYICWALVPWFIVVMSILMRVMTQILHPSLGRGFADRGIKELCEADEGKLDIHDAQTKHAAQRPLLAHSHLQTP